MELKEQAKTGSLTFIKIKLTKHKSLQKLFVYQISIEDGLHIPRKKEPFFFCGFFWK